MLRVIGNDESLPRQEHALASGAITNGKPIVVNTNGTVSAVAETTIAQSAGTPVTFNSGSPRVTDIAYDTNSDRVVIVYRDDGNSGHGTAIVGTVSGTSISFGTEVVFNAAETKFPQISYDTNAQKVLVTYQDEGNSNYGTAIVGTVDPSDNSISFGSETVFKSAATSSQASVYDPDSQKVIIASSIGSSGPQAAVATISGTSVSFGSLASFGGSNDAGLAMAYDTDTNRVVIAYRDGSDVQGKSVVGTVSGTSISFGSEVVYDSSGVDSFLDIAYDASAQKIVIAYLATGDVGKAIVGTVSGTSISYGTAATYDTVASDHNAIEYDPTAESVAIFYRDTTPFHGKAVSGKVSGTSITFTDQITFQSGRAERMAAVYDPDSAKVIVAYHDYAASTGDAVVTTTGYTSRNLTSENYIGMSRGVAFQTGSAASKGSATVFESASIDTLEGVYDPDSQKVIIGYRDSGNSSFGTAVVGTVSGTSISFGTPVVFESANCNHISLTYDTNSDKVVIAYNDEGNSRFGTAIVGTVSGTSISFGSAAVYESARSDNVKAAFDSNNNKVVIAYQDDGNSSHGTAVVATVSGTSISFGTPVVFEAAETDGISIVYDTNAQKIVIAYRDAGDSNQGRAIVGTVSGTSISFGTAVEFTSNNSLPIAAVYESDAQKIVIAFNDFVDTKGKAIVGTVSGTSISFGTEVTFENSYGDYLNITYDSSVGKVVIGYQDDNNSNTGTIISGKVSGTSISFDDPFVVAGEVKEVIPIYDANSSKVVIAYRDVDNSNHGTAVVTTTNTIATTRAELASGNQASVDIIGSVSDNQIGLTAGQQYFVQTDGTIGTTADSPSVLAGTAISATELLVKT